MQGDDEERTLVGRYLLDGEIAAGGMGRVYAATQISLDRRVAIKVATGVREELRHRFLLEAKTLARVSHKNVVTVHDCGESGEGVLFLVMELLVGCTLSQALRARGPMDIAEVRSLATQLARGLRAVHREGVVHRDLKPSNVFVVDDDDHEVVYKIFDFGIVKAEDVDPRARTREGVVIGTPTYMAPEQINGSAIDPRTDLYALGVVLYQALTGEPPFALKSAPALFKAHLERIPASPRTLRPEVPEDLERVVLKLLEKRPEDRFASADELLRALDGPVVRTPRAHVDAAEQDGARTEQLPRFESPQTPALGIHMHILPRSSARMIESPFSTTDSFARPALQSDSSSRTDIDMPQAPDARDLPTMPPMAPMPSMPPAPVALAPPARLPPARALPAPLDALDETLLRQAARLPVWIVMLLVAVALALWDGLAR